MTSAARHQNTMIRASAGTGKTYQLSNRYLQLLFSGQSPDRILAMTFTRKAAGEILARILYRLAEAAQDESSARRLGEQLQGQRESEEPLSLAACRRMLRQMTRNLHRLRVGTLDSFFLQTAQTLSLELGLPPGWTIVDDQEADEIRSEAIAGLLQDQETSVVSRLMHWLAQGETQRGVQRLMADTVAGLYEVFLEAPPTAWDRLSRKKKLALPELERQFELLLAWADASAPGKQLRDAVLKLVEQGRGGAWANALKGALPRSVVSGELTFGRSQLDDALVQFLEPVVEHGCAEIQNRLVEQLEASRLILTGFHGQVESQKFGRRALRFADLPRFLSRLGTRLDMEQLAFRLDTTIDHLLLDEFQDTSLDQWLALRRFAHHASAAEPQRSFFCVGDVKQAIYGWRGGNAELLEAVATELPEIVDVQLDRSFRSSPVIIDAVNRVNLGMDRHPRLGDAEAAVMRWVEEFPQHSTARDDLAGYVRIETHPAATSTDEERERSIERAVQRVWEVRQATPGHSIAVLVRTNDTVRRVIFELQRRGVAASEEAGNPLADAAAVQLIQALLQLADYPFDMAARFQLARSPWATELRLPHYRDDQSATELAERIRNQLLDVGYGATLDQWAEQLRPYCSARERRRVGQVVELAYQYQTALETPRQVGYDRQFCQPVGTGGFRMMIEQKRVSDPTEDPVRVMNVHQSKGLQFDVVILPDLDRRLLGQTPNCVVGRPHPTSPIDAICRWVNADVRDLFPGWVGKLHERYQTASVREELCTLYVALTRAVHAMYLILAPSEHAASEGADGIGEGRSRPRKRNADNLPVTYAGLIRAALTDQQPLEPDQVLFESGNPEWWRVDCAPQGMADESAVASAEGAEGASLAADGSASSVRPLLKPARVRGAGRTRGEAIINPSRLEGDGRVSLRRQLESHRQAAMSLGTLIHRLFEVVEWSDGPWPNVEDGTRIGRELGVTPEVLALALETFQRYLHQPAVHGVLRRDRYEVWVEQLRQRARERGGSTTDFRLQVRREQSLAALHADGMISGCIDRLVLIEQGGRPVAAELLDFKTDQVLNAADREQLVNHYAPQIQTYLSGAARMLRLPNDCLRGQLVFLESDTIVEVVAPRQPTLF